MVAAQDATTYTKEISTTCAPMSMHSVTTCAHRLPLCSAAAPLRISLPGSSGPSPSVLLSEVGSAVDVGSGEDRSSSMPATMGIVAAAAPEEAGGATRPALARSGAAQYRTQSTCMACGSSAVTSAELGAPVHPPPTATLRTKCMGDWNAPLSLRSDAST